MRSVSADKSQQTKGNAPFPVTFELSSSGNPRPVRRLRVWVFIIIYSRALPAHTGVSDSVFYKAIILVLFSIHIKSNSIRPRRGERNDAATQLTFSTFLFGPGRTPTHGIAPPTFRMGLPTSFYLL